MAIEMNNDEIFARIERKVTGWTESEWEGLRENFAEYCCALGEEATKSFSEFAWGIASQNILFEILQETK